ncbi:MAG: 5-carboxymethyl-2-hydroxymuconate isomerase [Puniceicoccaceae bacterium]|nr:MAG: 5-carboxymethyl-2-hydroxymuconate isomerase [Puniceicoccaceae bacterium]
MRICRLLFENEPRYAVEREGAFYLCEGTPFMGLEPTQQRVEAETLLAPIVPSTIYAIGLNYRAHAVEMGQPIPDYPVVTMKSPTALLDPGGVIRLPRFLPSDSVDYECELAVVIGRTCKNATPENALDYVLGYTAANDVSARDWQKIYSGGQWCKGKTFDTFCPFGPWLVTPDELSDPDQLAIRTELNGVVVQSSNTADMIFSVADLICFLSGSTTLAPGTLILTGTPIGVGAAQEPPRFLQPGDEVVVEIEGIGRLFNSVGEESLQPG